MKKALDWHVDKLEEANIPKRVSKNGSSGILPHSRLTAPQSKFVLLIVSGLPSAEAYKQAFNTSDAVKPTTIASRARFLLKNPRVIDAVNQRGALVCERIGVDPTFVVGRLAQLAMQENDRKAAVRALELLGRHLQPGFFGDNKPQPKETSDIKALLGDIATINRELLTIAKKRGDHNLTKMIEATALDVTATDASNEPECAALQPDETAK